MKANKHEINGYIYFTSDETIKQGDFIYIIRDGLLIEKINGIVKIESTTESQTKYVRLNGEKGWWASEVNYQKDWNYKKIILCNNPNLPIQQLSTEEVEYLKSVDSFEVTNLCGDFKPHKIEYKILIPQETEKERGITITNVSEQPKESIEEIAEKYVLSSVERNQYGDELSFIDGYNHAKQTLYSEDEVEQLLYKLSGKIGFYYDISINGSILDNFWNKHKKQ